MQQCMFYADVKETMLPKIFVSLKLVADVAVDFNACKKASTFH